MAGSATDRAARSRRMPAMAPLVRSRAGCPRERLRSPGSGWPEVPSSKTIAEAMRALSMVVLGLLPQACGSTDGDMATDGGVTIDARPADAFMADARIGDASVNV